MYLDQGLTVPDFAQFRALTDNAFTLPQPAYPNNFESEPFPLPDLDASRTAILMFRVRAHGTVRLQMTINDENCVDYLFDPAEPESTRPRSWHEVVPGRILDPQNNNLVAEAQPTEHGSGTVELSDIVIFYHASTEDSQP